MPTKEDFEKMQQVLKEKGIKIFDMYFTIMYFDKNGKEHRAVVSKDGKLYDHDNEIPTI